MSDVPASVALDKNLSVPPYLPIESYGTTTKGSFGRRLLTPFNLEFP